MTPHALPIAFALVALTVSCAGDGIGTPPPADGPTARFDLVSPDVVSPDVAVTDAPPVGDGAITDGKPPAGDLPPGTEGGGGACFQYSNWSCKVGKGALLCEATCGSDQLVCTNGGTCQCGIGLGPCKGIYSGPTPCDVCRKAWLGGCCKL